MPPSSAKGGHDFFFEVEQLAQSDVEEVAAAAGRIQNLDRGDFGGEGSSRFSSFSWRRGSLLTLGLVSLVGKLAGLRLDFLPFAAQGRHEHGFDDEQDIFLAGVMGAKLGALGRVEAALEEGAEDGGLDLAPIEGTDLGQDIQAVAVQVEYERPIIKVTVEIRYLDRPKPASGGHDLEELRELGGEGGGTSARLLDHAREQAGGKQAGIFGEEAE